MIVSDEEAPEDYCYESYPGTDLTLVVGSFRISPASFYLDANSFTDLSVRFEADKVGHHRCPLFVEGDNGEKTPITLVAVCDAVRLELARWPTLQEEIHTMPIEEGSCAWQLVPWQINWMRPGTQVGHKSKQSIQISNGGFMPMRVEWALAQPPRQILARLAVGSINRLTDKLINEIHDWRVHLPCNHLTSACPFKVEPASAMIEPFATATFTFSFEAFGPVGSQSAVFAYLMARDLPDSMACLLHYNQLVDLQDEMRPVADYSKHLPLFGGVVSQPFDKKLKCNGSTDPLDIKVADPKAFACPRQCFVLIGLVRKLLCAGLSLNLNILNLGKPRMVFDADAGLRCQPGHHSCLPPGPKHGANNFDNAPSHYFAWGCLAVRAQRARDQTTQLWLALLLL